ncbi:MAG: hypothetical protein H9Q66_05235, partial [Spiroplasma ixodetis]|nr:hypothetical protein [Spiroplasma ixodetis]
HKNPQHFKLLNSYQISRTSVYQKIVLKSVAIPNKKVNKEIKEIKLKTRNLREEIMKMKKILNYLKF